MTAFELLTIILMSLQLLVAVVALLLQNNKHN